MIGAFLYLTACSLQEPAAAPGAAAARAAVRHRAHRRRRSTSTSSFFRRDAARSRSAEGVPALAAMAAPVQFVRERLPAGRRGYRVGVARARPAARVHAGGGAVPLPGAGDPARAGALQAVAIAAGHPVQQRHRHARAAPGIAGDRLDAHGGSVGRDDDRAPAPDGRGAQAGQPGGTRRQWARAPVAAARRSCSARPACWRRRSSARGRRCARPTAEKRSSASCSGSRLREPPASCCGPSARWSGFRSSASAAEFWSALPAALALLVVNYVWVLRSDAAFEEASAEHAEQRREQARGPARGRQGRRPRRRSPWRRTARRKRRSSGRT